MMDNEIIGQQVNIKLIPEKDEYASESLNHNEFVVPLSTSVNDLNQIINQLLGVSKSWVFRLNESVIYNSLENHLKDNLKIIDEEILQLYFSSIPTVNEEPFVETTPDVIIQLIKDIDEVLSLSFKGVLMSHNQSLLNLKQSMSNIYISSIEDNLVCIRKYSDSIYLGVTLDGSVIMYSIDRNSSKKENFYAKKIFSVNLEGLISCFNISHEKSILAFGDTKGYVYLVNLEDDWLHKFIADIPQSTKKIKLDSECIELKIRKKLKIDNSAITSVHFEENFDKRLFNFIVSSSEGKVNVFDYISFNKLIEFFSGKAIATVHIYEDQLFIGHVDGQIRQWVKKDENYICVKNFDAHNATINDLYIVDSKSNGTLMLSISNDGSVALFSVSTGKLIFKKFIYDSAEDNSIMKLNIKPIACLIDQEKFYVGCSNRTLLKYSLE